METTSWTQEIAEKSPVEHVIPDFLRHIEGLGITPEQVKGRVLVVGQADVFPERSLLCTPESRFGQPRSAVTNIYCCDTTYPSDPGRRISTPCINTIFEDHVPDPIPNTTYYEPSPAPDLLNKMDPDFLDTVIMCRVPDVGKQIEEEGLIDIISTHLKSGGYFI